MDLKKFSSDANAFFNRAVQKTEETFKVADRTPLDPNLEELIKQCEQRYRWTSSLISMMENMLQPNPALRVEEKVLKTMDKKRERLSAAEQLGDSMIQIGGEVGATTSNGNALMKCGELQNKIGQAEKQMAQKVTDTYVEWLRSYLNNELKMVNTEKADLETARLDLDSAKNKLRRVKNDPSKQVALQEEVTTKQTEFNRHCATAKRAMELAIAEFDKQPDRLSQFVDSQMQYFNTCLESLRQAQQQMRSY